MRQLLTLAALAAYGCLLTDKAVAATLEVAPVFVSLAPGQTSTTIEVQNRGGAPAAIQVRPFAWSQSGDEDTLTPTQDIILSPPIFTIPKGASQTVRLLLRSGARAAGERSYRLLLDEVPSPNTANKQIVVTLRMSLPIIAGAASSGPPTLQWRAERTPDGQVLLTVVNTSRSYARVGAIDVTGPDGSHPVVAQRGKNPYVLPGAQRHWFVQGRGVAAGLPLRLSFSTQVGRIEQTLVP